MLAHQRTCRGERIVFADKLDSVGITPLANKGNVPRHVNMSRAQSFAGNALTHAPSTAMPNQMSFDLFGESIERIERCLGSFVPHRAIRCIANHLGERTQSFQCFVVCLAVYQFPHQFRQFRQAITARNAFPARLVRSSFKQRCNSGQRALARRCSLDPSLKSL